MKNLLLIIILIKSFTLFAQPEAEGTIRAEKKLIIRGNIEDITMEQGEELSYEITNSKVILVKNDIVIVKDLNYLKKLEQKGRITLKEKNTIEQSIAISHKDTVLQKNTIVAKNNITQNSDEADKIKDRKTQNKLNIIIGHIVFFDILAIISLIRLSKL